MRVLESRQRDGVLPVCSIYRDARTYIPAGHERYAEWVTAGFPCQARQWLILIFWEQMWTPFPKCVSHFLQGVSTAGFQRGLDDTRSSLVSEPFRVFDALPHAWGPWQAKQLHHSYFSPSSTPCWLDLKWGKAFCLRMWKPSSRKRRAVESSLRSFWRNLCVPLFWNVWALVTAPDCRKRGRGGLKFLGRPCRWPTLDWQSGSQ